MTTIIKVEGMSCEHCVRAVNTAAASVAGVLSAQADLEGKSVRIEHEEGLSLDAVKAAIREEGFEVE